MLADSERLTSHGSLHNLDEFLRKHIFGLYGHFKGRESNFFWSLLFTMLGNLSSLDFGAHGFPKMKRTNALWRIYLIPSMSVSLNIHMYSMRTCDARIAVISVDQAGQVIINYHSD